MENQDAVRNEISRLLASQLLAVLTTQEPAGQPYTSLLAFAAGNDLADIFLATDRTTRKFENIEGDNRVALLVYDRSNQPGDFRTAAAVTIIGKVDILENQEKEAVM